MTQPQFASKDLPELLPAYLNGTLDATSRAAVEAWLETDPQAPAQLAAWRAVRAAVVAQPPAAPTPQLRQRLLAQIHAAPVRAAAPAGALWAGWALALSVLMLALLWWVIQPGLGLQWSVDAGAVQSFRLYRAPVGETAFTLVSEVPAQPMQQSYTYVDTVPFPVQAYQYRVEGVAADAHIVASPTIVVSPQTLWPTLAAMLLVSVLVGVFGASVIQPRVGPGWQMAGV